jgi:hypothetical protein
VAGRIGVSNRCLCGSTPDSGRLPGGQLGPPQARYLRDIIEQLNRHHEAHVRCPAAGSNRTRHGHVVSLRWLQTDGSVPRLGASVAAAWKAASCDASNTGAGTVSRSEDVSA